MKKNKWIVLLLVVVIAFSLTGCHVAVNWISDSFPSDFWGPQDSETESNGELPTLPISNDLIPLDVLMDYPDYTPPQISADGSLILYRHMSESSDAVIAQNWQTGERTVVPWPNVRGNPYYLWAPDGETVLFFVDNRGDENYGLYTSNVLTGKTATILEGGSSDCYYVAQNPANEKEIFLAVFNFDTSLYDLYLYNYVTGGHSLVLQNPGDVTSYIFDHSGALRMVTRTDEMAGSHVWLKAKSTSGTKFVETEWRQVFSWDYEDADTSGVIGFMQDNTRVLYIDSSASNTSTLCTYDLTTGETVKVFNDADYDLNGTWTDLELDKVTAVNVYAQKVEWHVLDESFQADYEALSAVGDGVFDIIGSSEGDEYWLVQYVSDTSEADYYVYDMAEKKAMFLYNARPELNTLNLASVESL